MRDVRTVRFASDTADLPEQHFVQGGFRSAFRGGLDGPPVHRWAADQPFRPALDTRPAVVR
jgi:hypothetical protein